MTVYVRRNGRLVDKASGEPIEQRALSVLGFPTPRVSRFDSYQSPVSDKEVTSWRQRDREMTEHGCYDPRDVSTAHRRGRAVQLKELEEVRANGKRTGTDDTFQWRDTPE